jgi:hypothetical protein
MRQWITMVQVVGVVLSLSACATGSSSSSGITGNEGGSQPINEQEVNDYKRAVHKCYKTGGTRVVKINGKLRCYD